MSHLLAFVLGHISCLLLLLGLAKIVSWWLFPKDDDHDPYDPILSAEPAPTYVRRRPA